MKSLEYKTVNPGQDFNDQEDKLFQPPEDPSTAEQVETPNVTVPMADRVAEQFAQVTDQVAQDVIARIFSGLPEVINRMHSSRSETNRLSATPPKFGASQASTNVGPLGHDGAIREEV